LHRANATLLVVLGLLACATGGQRAALGWSLGGEAHVFVADDRFARDFYHDLNGRGDLMNALEGHSLIAVDPPPRQARSATVLSANGAAPARLTLARFHAPQTCGYPGVVTELVLAFPPGGAGGRSTPPSHMTVVALLDAAPFAGGPGSHRTALTPAAARALIRRVAERAENGSRGARLALLHPPVVDADQAADAGEVVALGSRYAVGFRATFVATVAEAAIDTTLITGVATTDLDLHELRWVVRPQRMRLHRGMITSPLSKRYSLRGTVAGPGGGPLLLLDEIADVAPRDSRATVVDPATRHVVAAQPLALRCP
jgi:hypothetical protein